MTTNDLKTGVQPTPETLCRPISNILHTVDTDTHTSRT
jgi:hypothetical protein